MYSYFMIMGELKGKEDNGKIKVAVTEYGFHNGEWQTKKAIVDITCENGYLDHINDFLKIDNKIAVSGIISVNNDNKTHLVANRIVFLE